jgi:putative membrane protein
MKPGLARHAARPLNMNLPASLCIAAALVLAIAGLNSRILADWWLENLVIAAFFLVIARSTRVRESLTPPSWWILFALLCLHEYGAAHAYATPLGEWMRQLPGLAERNHYDRLVHFLYGGLTVRAFRELAGGSSFIAVQSVLSTSAIYEMIEWLVAALVDPALGSEFVGAQGDDFDAAKDMGLAFLGSLAVFLHRRRERISEVSRS